MNYERTKSAYLKKEKGDKFVYLIDQKRLSIIESQLKKCKIEIVFLWYNGDAYKIEDSVFLDPTDAAKQLISIGQKKISDINSKIELAEMLYLSPYLKGYIKR